MLATFFLASADVVFLNQVLRSNGGQHRNDDVTEWPEGAEIWPNEGFVVHAMVAQFLRILSVWAAPLPG